MKDLKTTIISLAMPLCLLACGQEDSAPQATTVQLGLTTAAETIGDDSGASFKLERARFILRHIELDLPPGISCADVQSTLVGATCEADDASDDTSDDSPKGTDDTLDDSPDDNPELGKIVINGPRLVDLVAGTVTPSLDEVRLPDLAYARVDLRVDDDKSGLLDGEHSWEMSAPFTVDGADYSFKAILKFNEDIRFEAPQGVRVVGGPLLINFNADLWLKGLDVASCIKDEDLAAGQELLISDDSDQRCADFEGTLKKNLKRSGQLR